MFFHSAPKSDIDQDLVEELGFDDPSWVVDHHRHNLIVKISKSEPSSCGVLKYLRARKDPKDSEPRNRQGHIDLESTIASDSLQKNAGDTQKSGSSGPKPAEDPYYEQQEQSEQSYHINLAELQCLRLRQLQHKLVQHTVNLRFKAIEPPGWAEDLRDYVQALRDYDYMGEHVTLLRDPFYVTGQRYIERCMLQVAMRGKENDVDSLRRETVFGVWETAETRAYPVGGVRDMNFLQVRMKGLQQRIGVAAIGGIFLIVPMWLMVLHKTLYTSLVSTTVFVAVFGLVMATFLDKLMDVMSSTAAYAAVLVVFMGLSTSKPS